MTPSNTVEQLAYEPSVRALKRQEVVLDELRTRTGVLLAATSVVTSFLGARALSDGLAWLAVPGLLAALASILSSVYVLVPAAKVTFSVLAVPAYEHFVRTQADLTEAHRVLAYWNHEAWELNESVLKRLVPTFRAACWVLVVAVVLWSAKLAVD